MYNLKYKKVAILCDYGLDDAAATAFILEHHKLFEKIDIIPIAGNVPLKMSMKNALRILNEFEREICNIRIVDSSTISQKEEYLYNIHGKDGIGDFLSSEYDVNINIIDFNLWLNKLTDDYIIVNLGPCTVCSKILCFKSKLPILMMGGNLFEKPNYYGYEFNHGMDKDSFSYCIKHNHVIATLDTCHNPKLDFYKLNFNCNLLSSKFLKRSVELCKMRNERGAYIYDFIAIMYLFTPEKFIIKSCIDKDGNNLNVLQYVDDLFNW